MSNRALSLYRTILRLHRTALPRDMRALGDAYVRAEFRAFKDAEPQYVEPFMREWEGYAATMAQQSAPRPLTGLGDDAGFGKDLSEADLAALSEDQRDQLEELRREAAAVAAKREPGGGGEGGFA